MSLESELALVSASIYSTTDKLLDPNIPQLDLGNDSIARDEPLVEEFTTTQSVQICY